MATSATVSFVTGRGSFMAPAHRQARGGRQGEPRSTLVHSIHTQGEGSGWNRSGATTPLTAELGPGRYGGRLDGGEAKPLSPFRVRPGRPGAISGGHHRGMLPPLRREVPDDDGPTMPTPALARRLRDPSLPPRAWEPNRANPADHPIVMAVGGWLEVLSGVAALLTVLLVVATITVKGPESMSNFATAFLSLPLAAVTIVMLVVTSLLYVSCGASRRAAILGVLAALATATSCAWLVLLI